MHILYISTSFPKPSEGATIYTDLAEALHNAGHEITVAVSAQIKPERKDILNKERGFDVLRIPTGKYYDVGFIKKGLTMLKLPFVMKSGICKVLKAKKFDFILFEAPPVTNAGLVAWAKKKFNCPSYLMLKDIFPQNAVDLGIMRQGGFIYGYFKRKERKLYKTADIIGCMSLANKKYITDQNCWLNTDKVELFPNTKKVTDKLRTEGSPMRSRLGIPDNVCVFLFGGNMGRPQNIDLLCSVIKECKDDTNMYFLFVGRGTDRYKIGQTITELNLKNALLIENLPRDEYEQITRECDIGLIVLDPRFTIPNYPSRILSYMEYAKPVLAATDKNTDMKELIEEANCGEWVWSGDKKSFIKKIKNMASRKDLSDLGMNGRKYLMDHFTVDKSVEILERHFR